MLGFFLILLGGCAQVPSYKSDEFYEYSRNIGDVYYPEYHPGDLWGRIDEDYRNEISKECSKICETKYPRKTVPRGPDRTQEPSRWQIMTTNCWRICIEEKYKSLSIAKHIEGGYYSDGSYYVTYKDRRPRPVLGGIFIFRNIHPTRLKYQKTKWQKDRDECMKLTDENVKEGGIFERSRTVFNRKKEYYRNCLKERGHEIK